MTVMAEHATVGRQWLSQGRRVAFGLLVRVDGSAPFEPGAFMLIDADGNIEGSITGGCVEVDVVINAVEVLQCSGQPRLLHYAVSDELAHSVGLMCGGSVDVLVHELRGAALEAVSAAFDALALELPVSLATLVDGPGAGGKLASIGGDVLGTFGGSELLDHTVAADLAALGERRTSTLRRYGRGGEALGDEITVHLQAFGAPARLVLVGAIDYSAAVAALGAHLGYRVLVIDAREAFTRSERFSRVAEVHVGWPGSAIDERRLRPNDAVIVFSHDPKFDEPALIAALRSDAGYIGALGSRRTAADRNKRLLQAGADAEELRRVRSPCGLDIGASSPEEVAVSIMSEVIASRSGRIGESLTLTEGPIRPRHLEFASPREIVG